MSTVEAKARASCVAVSLGQVEYRRAWDLQIKIHRQVVEGGQSNVLLLLEHPHVYTLGRRGQESDILVSRKTLARLGADLHHVDRGGEATYHGPGQLVGYPIVNLRRWGGGPIDYVRTLEEALKATLAEFGIEAEGADRPTGVWAKDAKIAAIGVKISRGVTIHGFALNVNPDLSFFDHIVPCGLPGSRVASLVSLLANDLTVERVIPVVARQLGQAFGWTMEDATLEELNSRVG